MTFEKHAPSSGNTNTAFAAGFRALDEADWADACAQFRAGLAESPDCVEAWEGLGTAAYWIPDADMILESWERAYHIYREREDRLNAARMAAWMAVDTFELTGQDAVANGWLQRARRLIGRDQDTPENTWVTVAHGRMAFMLADMPAARRLAGRAAALARELKLPDLEALSLSMEGLARLCTGDVRRAVRCLDEASAIVLGGEARDLTFVALTLCQLMAACERTRDFDRARQWCAAARQFSQDRDFPIVLSICRPHYGAVLMWRGHWPEAEEHLQIGSRELMEFMPPFAVGALALLGGLRWRQGRWEEAEQIFERVSHEPPAQLGIAELRAGRGDLAGAIDILERYLRAVPTIDKLERGPALEALIRCLAATGERQRAAEHLRELHAIAESVRTPSLRASAAFAEGVLASATTDWASAQNCLGDAVELFEREGAPFEGARARIALAETLCERGRYDAAARDAHIAQEALVRIGATEEAARARDLQRVIDSRRATVSRQDPDGLTTREGEILTLLAQGRSNQEIAASLVLSVRTVERHISNIYEKLGLEGRTARTAAAAHAHRMGMKTPV